MRRRLKSYIPVLLFAVVLQWIAPIGAFAAVAHAVADPLAMASICSETTTAAGDAAPSHAPVAHAHCCAFCAAVHGATVAIEPPMPVFVTLQRRYQRVVWLASIDVAPAIRSGSNSKARAPPIFS
jgi:hypothetical protein